MTCSDGGTDYDAELQSVKDTIRMVIKGCGGLSHILVGKEEKKCNEELDKLKTDFNEKLNKLKTDNEELNEKLKTHERHAATTEGLKHPVDETTDEYAYDKSRDDEIDSRIAMLQESAFEARIDAVIATSVSVATPRNLPSSSWIRDVDLR